MNMCKTVDDIVTKFLNDNGYDGLKHDDDCCCLTDDRCDDATFDCQPAYKVPCDCDDGCNYHMTS